MGFCKESWCVFLTPRVEGSNPLARETRDDRISVSRIRKIPPGRDNRRVKGDSGVDIGGASCILNRMTVPCRHCDGHHSSDRCPNYRMCILCGWHYPITPSGCPDCDPEKVKAKAAGLLEQSKQRHRERGRRQTYGEIGKAPNLTYNARLGLGFKMLSDDFGQEAM